MGGAGGMTHPSIPPFSKGVPADREKEEKFNSGEKQKN